MLLSLMAPEGAGKGRQGHENGNSHGLSHWHGHGHGNSHDFDRWHGHGHGNRHASASMHGHGYGYGQGHDTGNWLWHVMAEHGVP